MGAEWDSGTGLERLTQALGSTLARLGLGPVELMVALQEEWEELAGEVWAGISRPIVVRNGELLVEADPPSAIRVLSYDTGALLQRIDQRFGPGSVANIKVVAKRDN